LDARDQSWSAAREPTGHFTGAEGMRQHPPPDRWDDWVEFDPSAWPKKVERRYMIIPTVCFNCEAACGLLAYIDKETLEVRKFEGNPAHPGSRGRNCAKGPATLSQINDPERILYPMRRVGKRGEGKWERVSWDEVLDDLGGRIRRAILDDRRDEVIYHVGRPGEDGYADRMLFAWGIDGHNSHTNVCSSSARVGYALWMGNDRPSPDHANAKFILLISSHLETGHYFNPHAQRITEGRMSGAKMAVMDPRLSNTASMADYWLPTWPGSEAAALLAMAKVILDEGWYDADFMRRWVNWEQYLAETRPGLERTFDNFISVLKDVYGRFTPRYAEQESGVPADTIVDVAREVARAGHAFASHTWRAATAGNLGGWQVSRCLFFLHVLTGSVGTPGGVSPNWWNKFVPAPFVKPPPNRRWNEILWPREFPLAHHELSILLPHFVKEGRGRIDTYFSRVYNPVWTNPDGFSWIEMLTDEDKVGCHAHLSPVWSETSWFADYILPMGLGSERHDTHSYETHAGRWIGFRQPVLRVAMERLGRPVRHTYEANPGEVWEESEFWIELSWRIDPDGELGIRRYFESPYRPGRR
jgi:anaerobic selenocysteine-containing dehydrogenase